MGLTIAVVNIIAQLLVYSNIAQLPGLDQTPLPVPASLSTNNLVGYK